MKHDLAIEKELLDKARRAARAGDAALASELWSRGFLPSRRRLYDFQKYGYDSFLSDLQREHTRKINGPYQAILNNKLCFDLFFRDRLRTPKIYGTLSAPTDLLAIPDNAAFFAKPVGGGGGSGVVRGVRTGSRIWSGGGEMTTDAFFAQISRTGTTMFLSEAVAQHPDIERIFDKTTNTIRLLMARLSKHESPFVIAAVLRVGRDPTAMVDNFSRGGLSVKIDVSSGQLMGGRTQDGSSHAAHPVSAVSLVNATIPLWEEVIELCHAAMNAIPELRYVGWDVIVAGDGPVLLEGNNYSDVNLLQVHGPLLADDRVREFYEAAGILGIRPSQPLDA